MKILMFGWEFPPHITGGLGTASYGLVKGFKSVEDAEIIFVVPKAYGDEDLSHADLIGANNIKQTKKTVKHTENYKKVAELSKETSKIIEYIEVKSQLRPYMSPEEFEILLKNEKKSIRKDRRIYTETQTNTQISNTDFSGFEFTGKYGNNLMQEVAKYAEIASIIAAEYDFDIIHAHDWLTYLAGISAAEASGKPLIIHVHATEFDRSGENINKQVYDIERYGMQKADHIITVSNLTRNIVVERYNIDPQKITTVYNAVEFEAADNKQPENNRAEKVVTFLGRVTFQKGPEYFVEAAYKVLQRTDKVRFVMAGSGDLLNRMIRRSAELGITDKFHFTDFLKQEDVKKLFAMSDVYVMPSVSEPFGISPLEALRSNVPVIISKQSGVAEILNHAVKVDFWDINELADAIFALISYNSLNKIFVEHGKEEVNRLKWENAAQKIYSIYNKILQK